MQIVGETVARWRNYGFPISDGDAAPAVAGDPSKTGRQSDDSPGRERLGCKGGIADDPRRRCVPFD
jgi:hypothetical protein